MAVVSNRTVIAVVGGLGAALAWAVATLAGARASRDIGAITLMRL